MSEKDISKIQINDSLYHLMDNDAREQIVELSGKLIDLEDYTAFEVLIHGTNVKAGDTIDGITYNYDFAGTYTHSFRLRTGEVDNTTSDVIIDWGDGTIHAIANGDYYSKSISSSSKDTDYDLTHTYKNEGKYIIKIYGRMYYGISVCSGSMPSNLNHNCICRLFDNDLPIASNLTNISSMCRYAYRLTSVDVPSYLNFSHISNISLLFNSCTNLKTVKGLKNQFLVVTAAGQIFEKCYSLQTCEFTLPVAVTRSFLNSVFHYCISLTTPIQDLFPACGFIGGTLNIDNIFTSCKSMPGTVPADMLWNNKNVKFTNTTYAFWGNTPDAIRSQVPASWGGMASDDIIVKPFTAGMEDVVLEQGAMNMTVEKIEAGKRYLLRNLKMPVASLTVNEVENSSVETQIWFHTEIRMTVAFPASVGWIGEPSFEDNKFYIISIQNNVAVACEYTPGVTV